jgi:hypothetical protein
MRTQMSVHIRRVAVALAGAVAAVVFVPVLAAPASAHQSDSAMRYFHDLCTSSSSCVTKGNLVRFWQNILVSRWMQDATLNCQFVDGSFGTNTKAYTREWQSSWGLSDDGRVGDNTWGELSSLLVATSANSYSVTYKYQPNSAYVAIYADRAHATGKWRFQDFCDGRTWKPMTHS